MSDFKAKMHQIQFRLAGWGSAPDLAGGAYSTLPDFILLKERGRGREGGVGEGEEKERREPQKLVYTPMSEIMKNIDCTTV